MNYKQLAKDIANDNSIVEEINLKYELKEVDWLKLYSEYINFPVLRNNLGYNYVGNEYMINYEVISLKNNISEVEYLISNERDIWQVTNFDLNINMVYKTNGDCIDDLSDYLPKFKTNYENALKFIEANEITSDNLTKLWQVLGHDIIDFHPVQGPKMYRAVDLELYNHFDRLLVNCIPYNSIEQAVDDLVKLASFTNERDEYANLLIAVLIKIYFLKIAPFYRFNEQMADLFCLWFLKKQKYRLLYFPTNYILSLNVEQLNRGFTDNRFSYREQDISLLMSGMIKALNSYFEAFKYIKKASDILVSDLDILTTRERDYLFIILTSKFQQDYFNWEMVNDELKKIDAKTTKAGVLKILNRLEQKKIILSVLVGRSKMFKINS